MKPVTQLTGGSLFSGIGGLDKGLEQAGVCIQWQCESDEFSRRVLAKHWPDVPCYLDVKEIDHDTPKVDILFGGFPCQPVSTAGRRKVRDDPRWLWPEFARAIAVLRPRYVFVENVAGLRTAGMGFVLASLATLGYDAEWDGISAAGVGAPHLRERVFIVAYTNGGGAERRPSEGSGVRAAEGGEGADDHASRPGAVAHAAGTRRGEGQGREGGPLRDGARRPQPERRSSDVADAGGGDGGPRRQGRPEHGGEGLAQPERAYEDATDANAERRDGRARVFGQGWGQEPENGGWWPAFSHLDGTSHGPACGMDGAAGWECGVPRTAKGQRDRVQRLRALGNAVVPAVAEYVGRRIMAATQDRR